MIDDLSFLQLCIVCTSFHVQVSFYPSIEWKAVKRSKNHNIQTVFVNIVSGWLGWQRCGLVWEEPLSWGAENQDRWILISSVTAFRLLGTDVHLVRQIWMYSRTPLKAYPSVDGPGYALWRVSLSRGNFWCEMMIWWPSGAMPYKGLCHFRGMP